MQNTRSKPRRSSAIVVFVDDPGRHGRALREDRRHPARLGRLHFQWVNGYEIGMVMLVMIVSIGHYLEGVHDQRWDDQVAPDGTSWAPLTETSSKLKPRNEDKILVLDELLQGSLAFNADADSLEFGTVLEYGAKPNQTESEYDFDQTLNW